MKANESRYWDMLMELGTITDPGQPYTRRSFSERFLEGRQWLTEKMQALGLRVHIDAAGNLIGRREGTDPTLGTIAIGSHSDTVPGGGRFDGVAGVVAGLECVASWNERNIQLRHPVEIIDFLAEEPSEWGNSCTGSRGISGFLDDGLLNMPHPKTGETLAQAIKRIGGDPDNLSVRKDIAACFEIHIEQGSVLEHESLDIGVVNAIVGIVRVKLVFKGQSAHAGTTPMHIRRDALAAAAQTACEIRRQVQRMAEDGSGHYVVATCGQFNVRPNASNVVPGLAEITIEMRSDHRPCMDTMHALLHEIAGQAARDMRVELVQFETLTDTHPVLCDAALMAHIEGATKSLGLPYRIMPSGAGHDAAFMTYVAPSAMIFVPSKEGKSHCAEEWTSEKEMAQGVSVLIEAVERFDANHLAQINGSLNY